MHARAHTHTHTHTQAHTVALIVATQCLETVKYQVYSNPLYFGASYFIKHYLRTMSKI